jgi:hypothetical protein
MRVQEEAVRLVEAENKIAGALLGKSDEAVRVHSITGRIGILVVVFSDGDEVEIEVRA